MTDLLAVEGLGVEFDGGRGRGLFGRRLAGVRAVDAVSFSVNPGELIALVGESGSGKTTAIQAAARLLQPTAGTVRFQGTDLHGTSKKEMRALRRQIQLIYQDPYESLDPRYRVERIIEEPLRVHGVGSSRADRRELVLQALREVGLSPPESFLDRMPHELSGGQRQRVSIAAALVLKPALLIADEPVSMLDVSVRAGILDLLDGLRRKGLGIVMVTHDLSTAAHYADRIAVMYLGRIVETGPSRAIMTDPQHPYTQALLAAVPKMQRRTGTRALLQGESPDASAMPTGCRFHPRCPIAVDECRVVDPEIGPTGTTPGHQAACLLRRRTPTD